MASSYPQIVLFGDSLFQHSAETLDGFCFQGALQNELRRRYDVVNRGLSGWTSANALEYVPQLFPERTASSPKMDYLVILLGANDSVLDLPSTTQHVPLEQYKANLNKIINHPRITAHKPKILLVTPPPLDEIKTTKLDTPYHGQSMRHATNSASYSETARQVAKENPGVVTIDLQKALMDKAISMAEPGDYQEGGPCLGSPACGKQGGLDRLLPDGLHMGGEAYRVFYDTLIPHLAKELQDLGPYDRTGYVVPDWTTFAQAK